MSPHKEPHFFVEPGDGLEAIDNRIHRLADYERLFDPDCAVRGEASTSYSHYPARRGVPERIRAAVPEARFIYVVRDPIDRLVSHYQHQVIHEGERRPLARAVQDLHDPNNIFVCAGRYATQVERYLRLFGPERMLVIDQADLMRRRVATMAEVYTFLGVGPLTGAEVFARRFNATSEGRRYSHAYARLRNRAPLRRLPQPIRAPLRRLGERAERFVFPSLEPPELPAALRDELTDIFSDEVARLRALTGKPFATWSL